jgi:hypothetical protein
MNPTPEEYADITEVAGLDDTLKVLVATMKRLPAKYNLLGETGGLLRSLLRRG